MIAMIAEIHGMHRQHRQTAGTSCYFDHKQSNQPEEFADSAPMPVASLATVLFSRLSILLGPGTAASVSLLARLKMLAGCIFCIQSLEQHLPFVREVRYCVKRVQYCLRKTSAVHVSWAVCLLQDDIRTVDASPLVRLAGITVIVQPTLCPGQGSLHPATRRSRLGKPS